MPQPIEYNKDPITNLPSHVLWLWIAYAGLTSMCVGGYLRLSSADVDEERRSSIMQLDIKVRLTAIETQLANMNCMLVEVKRELANQKVQEYHGQ